MLKSGASQPAGSCPALPSWVTSGNANPLWASALRCVMGWGDPEKEQRGPHRGIPAGQPQTCAGGQEPRGNKGVVAASAPMQ